MLHAVIKDRRQTLDNIVVGNAFVDFRKAFDSISHHVLLGKVASNPRCG